MIGRGLDQGWATALVPELVAARAAQTPAKVAISVPDRVLTYGELDAAANRLAHFLQARGVGPEVRVGLCLERSAALVIGALAVLKAGGAYLPLDPAAPAERLAFMLRDAAVPVLLTDARLAAILPRGLWETVALDADAARIARESAAVPVSHATAANLAYVIYTSGSTGQPKGVEIEHDALLNLIEWHQAAFALTAADRTTQVASPAFDAAVWELWPALAAGATILLPDEATRVAPLALRDWLVAERITVSFLPTPLAERVLALDWPQATAMRFLLTGGDALHHRPSPALPFTLVNNYGPSENTVVATSAPVAVVGEEPPPIGWPIANTVAHVLDEALQPVAAGEVGELWIGGRSLARGYLGRPELTAERFIADPFAAAPGARLYRTGDLVRLLPDGQLAFLGRGDDQVKIRGYRIELGEIIAALNACPGVTESLVVAREDTPGNKRLVAYIIPAPDAALSADTLREALAARLPDYMVPVAFVRLDAFPLTTNGKIDRRALPLPDADNTTWEADYIAPRTPTEEGVAAIVAALVGMERVGVDEDFFLLGGHSLLGTQVIARIRDTFGIDLPLRAIFEAPTVAELAAEIDDRLLASLAGLSDADLAALLAE
jgi:amino acid adenylation domain-containing protein